MPLTDEQAKDKLINRLRRIEGQIRGVQSMVSEERNCQEIIQQLTAIRSAVHSVSLILVEDYMSDCLVNLEKKDQTERETIMQDLIKLLGRVP